MSVTMYMEMMEKFKNQTEKINLNHCNLSSLSKHCYCWHCLWQQAVVMSSKCAVNTQTHSNFWKCLSRALDKRVCGDNLGSFLLILYKNICCDPHI